MPRRADLSRRRDLLRQALAGLAAIGGAPLARATPGAAADAPPIFDAHLHYSHDAVELVPPAQAVALLRAAGLRGALVSSSDDEGTQLLARAAPDLVVPELRPYRRRADIATWVRDEAIVGYLEARLAKHRYVGIGEFHLYGADAELPVPRRMVALAREHGLLLHAHSDADAVERLFRLWPEARILWAHAGFERPEAVTQMLARHPRLSADLAFRSEHIDGRGVAPAWRAAFEAHPGRYLLGTDTFVPERWHAIGPHAASARTWLPSLGPALAEVIGWRNAEALLRPAARGA